MDEEKLQKLKDLAQFLKEEKAELRITKPDYAYLKIGNMSYYFHRSKGREVEAREIETMGGERVTQTVVPYDGWEWSNCNCDKC